MYNLIARCTTNGRHPLNENIFFRMCKQDSSSEESTNIYTKKELFTRVTTISNFNTSFYIPAIQKLEFNITQVKILGTNHCGDYRQTAFKRCE